MSEFQLIKDFASQNSREWRNILNSNATTITTCDKIVQAFSDVSPLLSSDADLVVFGSLARNECTSGSDVDWTLLVDGQVSNSHYQSSNIIKKKFISLKLQEPGTSGMFGNITFSHDLVHYIGGEDDTNHNISRRILLLLESDKLLINSESDVFGTAYERVIKAIINEYIIHDSGLSSVNHINDNVPRFLLNDIIRFWRTMCVDFAYKQKEQEGLKWGLRNIKLRMSRKLIYLKGLLMCFSCYNNKDLNKENIPQHLTDLTLLKPLDLTLKILGPRKVDSLLLTLIDKYDEFLGMLDDEKIREELKSLNMHEAYANGTFLHARKIAHEFQDAISEIFMKDAEIMEFSKKYIIF